MGMTKQTLHENPDSVPGGITYYDSDAAPFMIYPDMYMWGSNVTYPDYGLYSKSALVHPAMTAAISNSVGKTELFDKICKRNGIQYKGDYEKTYKLITKNAKSDSITKSHLIKGRVWTDRGVVSFWDSDEEVVKNIKKIFTVLAKYMDIENPANLMWDIRNDELNVNGTTIQPKHVVLGDALRIFKGSGDNEETEEQRQHRELMMQYHNETNPIKKKYMAQKLGMIKPAPLKFGMSQWQADQVRGVAESVFKKLVSEMYEIEDDKPSLSERLIKECMSGNTAVVDKDFKKYMTDRNLV